MNSFDKVYIQFATAGDGSATIRKWSQFPFDNGNEYTLTAALSHSPEEPGDPPPKDHRPVITDPAVDAALSAYINAAGTSARAGITAAVIAFLESQTPPETRVEGPSGETKSS
jgi:hypothetical protein